MTKAEGAGPRKHAGEFHWSISLDVDCPYCHHDFNAENTPDFWEGRGNLQVCQESKGIEVVCPCCDTEFVFDIGMGQ